MDSNGIDRAIESGAIEAFLHRKNASSLLPTKPSPKQIVDFTTMNRKIDISEAELPNFENTINPTLGMVQRIPGGVVDVEKCLETYDSWWNPAQATIYEPFKVGRRITHACPLISPIMQLRNISMMITETA